MTAKKIDGRRWQAALEMGAFGYLHSGKT